MEEFDISRFKVKVQVQHQQHPSSASAAAVGGPESSCLFNSFCNPLP
jgi:hypothetical protein